MTALGSTPHALSPPTFQSTLLTACICHVLTSVCIARSVNAVSPPHFPRLLAVTRSQHAAAVRQNNPYCAPAPDTSNFRSTQCWMAHPSFAQYNTIQASPDRHRLRYAAPHSPAFQSLVIHLFSPACSSPMYRKQLFLWRSS
jgi:hypothetical protein